MTKRIWLLLFLLPIFSLYGENYVDVYSFKLRLKVPQVFNNSTSKGYRKFQLQYIKGQMLIEWQTDGTYKIEFADLKNYNFKVQDACVTYEAEINTDVVSPHYTYIGSNQSNVFKTPSIGFLAQFEPSYAIGEAAEDNSFTLMIAGKGAPEKLHNAIVAKTFRGRAAGMQGCGCYAYGHKSPTREATILGAGTEVTDVVATYGTWVARFQRRVKVK